MREWCGWCDVQNDARASERMLKTVHVHAPNAGVGDVGEGTNGANGACKTMHVHPEPQVLSLARARVNSSPPTGLDLTGHHGSRLQCSNVVKGSSVVQGTSLDSALYVTEVTRGKGEQRHAEAQDSENGRVPDNAGQEWGKPLSAVTDQPPTGTELLIGEYQRETGINNRRTLSQLSEQVAKCLRQGYSIDTVRAGLMLWRSRSTRPGILPRWVQYAANTGAAAQPAAQPGEPSPTAPKPAAPEFNRTGAIPDRPDPNKYWGPNPNPYLDKLDKGIPLGYTGDAFYDNLLDSIFDRSKLSPEDRALCERIDQQAKYL